MSSGKNRRSIGTNLLRSVAYLLAAAGLVSVGIAAVIGTLIIERTPWVTPLATPGATDATGAQNLVKDWAKALLDAEQGVVISASETDLNRVAAFVARAVPSLQGRVDVVDAGARATLSLRLPRNPFGEFVNARVVLRPSRAGLDIRGLDIGRVSLPGPAILSIGRLFMNLILGDRQGTAIVDAIGPITISDQTVFIRTDPLPRFKVSLKRLTERARDLRDQVQPLGDPTVVRGYYRELIEVAQRQVPSAPISLAEFVQPVFALALERSAATTAASENRAAILALAIFLGDDIFERLVGRVRVPGMPDVRVRANLAGRRDLMLHFVISAGIEVVANSGITLAIGEFKELLDADGGSGFSFVDLAADRAGARLASVAIDNRFATTVQSTLARAAETDFFPYLGDLPENLGAETFERTYGDVNNPAYQEMIREIDRRITALVYFGRSQPGRATGGAFRN